MIRYTCTSQMNSIVKTNIVYAMDPKQCTTKGALDTWHAQAPNLVPRDPSTRGGVPHGSASCICRDATKRMGALVAGQFCDRGHGRGVRRGSPGTLSRMRACGVWVQVVIVDTGDFWSENLYAPGIPDCAIERQRSGTRPSIRQPPSSSVPSRPRGDSDHFVDSSVRRVCDECP